MEGQDIIISGSDAQPIDHSVESPAADNTSSNGFLDTREEISISALHRILRETEKEEAEEKAAKAASPDEDETKEETIEDEKEGSEEKSEEKEPSEGEEKGDEVLEATSDSPPKEISFMVGDKEVTLPNNAVLEVTVDGKKRKIPLQEALNKASGELAVEDRFAKFQSEKAKTQNELARQAAESAKKEAALQERTDVLKNIDKLAASGNVSDLIGYLAYLSGGNPKDVIKKLYSSSIAMAEKFSSASPDSQEAFYERLEASVERARLANERKKLEGITQQHNLAAESRAAETYARAQLADIGSDEGEFREMATFLTTKGIALKGQTAQDKVDEVLDYLHERRVISVAKELDPALLNDKKLLQKTFDVTLSLGGAYRKTETIKKILTEFSGKKAKEEGKRVAETLSRKVRSNGTNPKKAKEADAKEKEVPFTLTGFNRRRRGF